MPERSHIGGAIRPLSRGAFFGFYTSVIVLLLLRLQMIQHLSCPRARTCLNSLTCDLDFLHGGPLGLTSELGS